MLSQLHTQSISLICLLAMATGCEQSSIAQTGGTSSVAKSPTASTTKQALNRVRALPPTRKDLVLLTTQPCRIAPYEQTPLYAKLPGYVEELLVDIGDHVEKGQILLRLSIPEMDDELAQKQALVAQAQAEVEQAEAAQQGALAVVETAKAKVTQAEAGIGRATGEFERWKAEYERFRELANSGAVTQKIVEETLNQFRSAEASTRESEANVVSARAMLNQARAELKRYSADINAANARLKVAQANLDKSRTMLEYRQIAAPYEGVITARHVDSGQFVQPASGAGSTPLLEIMTTIRVRAGVDIPELEAALINVSPSPDSATIRVQTFAGQTFVGHVSRTSWALDRSNRSMYVEIDLENADQKLRPGMYATATIELDKRQNVLCIPATAVLRMPEQTLCAIVVDGKIQHQPVTLGLRSGSDIEVVSGLNASDLVVQTQPEQYSSGQDVELIAAN